ncbi:MAG TPA: HD domain-containing protein [Candidatus Saccharimonadales bacterium]|nr:HD domain-containing protein [Candidatus Saccharimonadales bacterium]
MLPSFAMTARLASSQVPEPIRDVLHRLHEAGHKGYVIGGAVRELLVGEKPAPQDWDLGTSATPDQVLALFRRGIATGARFGTITVPTEAGPCEVTTFRVESEYRDARRPERVTFVRELEEDLKRRDFTVNAIAWDPLHDRLVDPTGGIPDLEARLLRAVGEPRDRFREDGLRPIRAARFAATLEFTLEKETERALPEAREEVGRVAAERVQDELLKMLRAREPSRGFEVLRRAGLLDVWLPELQRTVAVPQNRYHAYDVWFHTLHTCDAAPAEKPVVRLAALFHDVGKPETRAEKEDGEATFYNHQVVGEAITRRAMERLRFSRDLTDRVSHLVRQHMFDYRPEWSDAAVRRFIRSVGVDAIADLFDLRIADNIGNGLKTGFPHYLGELRARVEATLAAEEALSVRDLAVNGEDVMRAMRLPPGPRVGEILDQLLEEVLENPSLNRRETLLERVRTGFSVDTHRPGT